MASKRKSAPLTTIKYVVGSQNNIIVMPRGPDDDESVFAEECQALADRQKMPVRLMYHSNEVKQFDPKP